MSIEAEFITSAATAADFPRDRLLEVALVGRSNVGKSSLINALVGRRLARTSAAPGKTRLVNVYRVRRTGRPAVYLVDLPGYGYARGGREASRELEEVTREYFASQAGAHALLLVDGRHPAMPADLAAWQWLRSSVESAFVVATKIDKLARGQRIRATGELESAFDDNVLAVSAGTGEGLEELWKLIDALANNRRPSLPRRNPSLPSSSLKPPPEAMAQRHPNAATGADRRETRPPRRLKR